jgi:hypothetical protein
MSLDKDLAYDRHFTAGQNLVIQMSWIAVSDQMKL